MENAKKQKKQKQEEKNNLAAVTPLDNKKVIIVDTDSRTSFFQEDEDDKPSKTATDEPLNDKTFTQSSSNAPQLEQEQNIKNPDDYIDNDSESHNIYYMNESVDENSERPIEEQRQWVSIKDKIVQDTKLASTSNNSANILPFEIFWIFKDIRSYLAPLHSKIGDNGRVWISGLIDKSTGKIISHNFGRLNQLDQQPHQKHDGEIIDSNCRDGADDL